MLDKAAPDKSNAGKVLLEYLPSGIPMIRLGHPGERVVTLTMERMASLREALQKVRAERPRAVVIAGPHVDMFTAGADLNLIAGVTDPSVGEKLAREGQAVYDEIAALPCISIAAISGPCVGGGCELVLACNLRLISDAKSSQIGLPEVKLGILPGFGGTQRLPRLIGVVRALNIITAAKILKPKEALHAGLVNEIVAVDKLMDRANQLASGEAKLAPRTLKFFDKLTTFNSLARSWVKSKAQKQVARAAKGFYPAPVSALNSIFYGLEHGMQAGLKNEARELGRLIVTPESKSLVRVFFLDEKAKSIGKSAKKSVEHVHAVVIGAGVMGAGIASIMARNECAVILKDTADASLQRGMNQIKTYLQHSRSLSDQEKSFILNRVEGTTSASSNLGNANFAIEAIFEELEIKKRVLGEVADLMPPDSIIATNTSSLSVTEIASAIKSPERVVGMHFFNPVPKMPLVEIIRGKLTSDRTISIVAALATKLGKSPIVVKDVPGFLVNRILTPYLNEAAFLLEEYSTQEIDKAALSFGLPMGPLRLLDEIGLDVAMHVQEIMLKGYGDRMRGPTFTKLLVDTGRKGQKSGSGFYKFADKEAAADPEIRNILKLAPAKQASDLRTIKERLIVSLVNEAVRCLDEGVAGAPGPEAACQIDLGTVFGMGFPPFHGGVLNYADSVGAAKLLEALQGFEKSYGARFSPAPGIVERAKSGKHFCT